MSQSDTTATAAPSSAVGTSRKLGAAGAYLLAAVCGAVGQFCFKVFAGQLAGGGGSALAASPYLWVAIASYFAVMGLFIVGLRLWGELSTLYPVYGSTFAFALLLAALWLDEPITPGAIAGCAAILVGIVLLNLDARPSAKERP